MVSNFGFYNPMVSSYGAAFGASYSAQAPSSASILPFLLNQRQAPAAAPQAASINDLGGMMGLFLMLTLLKGKPQAPQITVPQQSPVFEAPQTVTQTTTQVGNPQIRPQTPDGPNFAHYQKTAQWWMNTYNGGQASIGFNRFAEIYGQLHPQWANGGNVGLMFRDADRDADGQLSTHEMAKLCERVDLNHDLRNDIGDFHAYTEKLRNDGTAKLLGVG